MQIISYFLINFIVWKILSSPLKPLIPTSIGSIITRAKSFVNINGTIYDIEPLYNINEDYSFDLPLGTLNFNFYNSTQTICKNTLSFINFITFNSTCKILSTYEENKYLLWKIYSYSNKQNNYIKIYLPQGEKCKTENQIENYNIKYEIHCNEEIQTYHFSNFSNFDIDYCKNEIILYSRYGCPIENLYSLSNIINNNHIFLGLAMLFSGIYFCFFAYCYIDKTIIMTGIYLIVFIVFFIGANFLSITFTNVNFYIILVFCIIGGLLFGYFILKRYPFILGCIIGLLMGFIFSEILFNILLKFITFKIKGVFYIIFACLGVVGIIIGGFFYNHMFIFGASFIGSYGIMRGFGTLYQNFPNERMFYDLIKRNEWYQINQLLNYAVYLYIIFLFIFGICGIIYQYKKCYPNITGGEEKKNYQKID